MLFRLFGVLFLKLLELRTYTSDINNNNYVARHFLSAIRPSRRCEFENYILTFFKAQCAFAGSAITPIALIKVDVVKYGANTFFEICVPIN